MKKRLLAIAIMISIFMTESMVAFAAPKKMPDGRTFDASYYADRYPDVVSALGRDENALYNHYLTYGQYEGRSPYEGAIVAPASVFDTSTAEGKQNQSIYNAIMALKNEYPEGTPWGMEKVYNNNSGKRKWAPDQVMACQAFAYMVQDKVFGDAKFTLHDTRLIEEVVGPNKAYTKYNSMDPSRCWELMGYNGDNAKVNANFEKIYARLRPGDVMHDLYHSMVVLSKDNSGVTVVEGNINGIVHWGRKISKESLRKGLEHVESAY